MYKLFYRMNKVTYVRDALALDIETTSTYIDGEKVAFPYVYQIGYNHEYIEFRYIHELKKWLDDLSDSLNGKRIICLVHNLSFEFTFLSSFLDFTDIFATGVNTPIKCCYKNIELRCSYAFSNMSLDTLAKNYTSTKKLKGDLDYTIVRYPETPLTDHERAYCINDVLILNEFYMDHILPEYVDKPAKAYIPLTNTGKVRKYCKEHIRDRKTYRSAIKYCFPTKEMQMILEKTFMGGYVHSNRLYTNQIINNVHSFDFTSSYPAVMLRKKYPMSRFTKRNVNDAHKYGHDYAKVMRIVFEDLQSVTLHSIISYSKCITCVNPNIDNGRIISADYLEMYLTDVDLSYIMMFYKCKKMRLIELYTALYAPLPHFLLRSIVHFYKGKTDLKGKHGMEKEYMNLKNMLNSNYGMMVSKPCYDEIYFINNQWKTKEGAYEFKNQFLLFQWGIWVTAWARFELLKTLRLVHENVIYCDTDSMKVINVKEVLPYIEQHNKDIEKETATALDELNISPDDVQGIGLWEWETRDTPYKRFKTLGAKKYAHDDEITVSGISKAAFKEKAHKSGKECIDLLKSGVFFDDTESGKNTITYCYQDKRTIHYKLCPDEKNEHTLEIGNFVHIEPTTYQINMSKDYKQLIQMCNELNNKIQIEL